MEKTTCKMECTWKTEVTEAFSVKLQAVGESSEENAEFFRYTPAGSLDLYSINLDAGVMFEVGKEYYIDIRPA